MTTTISNISQAMESMRQQAQENYNVILKEIEEIDAKRKEYQNALQSLSGILGINQAPPEKQQRTYAPRTYVGAKSINQWAKAIMDMVLDCAGEVFTRADLCDMGNVPIDPQKQYRAHAMVNLIQLGYFVKPPGTRDTYQRTEKSYLSNDAPVVATELPTTQQTENQIAETDPDFEPDYSGIVESIEEQLDRDFSVVDIANNS